MPADNVYAPPLVSGDRLIDPRATLTIEVSYGFHDKGANTREGTPVPYVFRRDSLHQAIAVATEMAQDSSQAYVHFWCGLSVGFWVAVRDKRNTYIVETTGCATGEMLAGALVTALKRAKSAFALLAGIGDPS